MKNGIQILMLIVLIFSADALAIGPPEKTKQITKLNGSYFYVGNNNPYNYTSNWGYSWGHEYPNPYNNQCSHYPNHNQWGNHPHQHNCGHNQYGGHYGHGHGHNHGHGNNYGGGYGYGNGPMHHPNSYPNYNQNSFSRFIVVLNDETFDSNKTKMAITYANSVSLNVHQIGQILQTFTFDSNRLEFAKKAYKNCYDKHNYVLLKEHFNFSLNFDELMDFIH